MPRIFDVDRIKADILAHIESGLWPPGHKLPSIPKLAEHYGCSQTPVKQAERDLQLLGYLEGHSGKGLFVADRRADPEPG